MPKKYKPFEVMKETDARERLRNPKKIFYGPIGPPPKHLDIDGRIAWLDLVVAAPPGRLEKHHGHFVAMTASLVSMARRGEANKGMLKLMGKNLRCMGLTPGNETTPVAILDAFDGRGPIN